MLNDRHRKAQERLIALARRSGRHIIPYALESTGRCGQVRRFGRLKVRLPAGVAQLAEHNVANVVVVGSNPITRSFS